MQQIEEHFTGSSLFLFIYNQATKGNPNVYSTETKKIDEESMKKRNMFWILFSY